MANKSSFLLLALGTLLFSANSLASQGWTQATFFSVYDYSRSAYGKTVNRVEVHSGIAQRSLRTGEVKWEAVQHIPLRLEGDRFVGSAVQRTSWTTPGPTNLGPQVQYWITFEDGTRKITRPSAIAEDSTRREKHWCNREEDVRAYLEHIEGLSQAHSASSASRTQYFVVLLNGAN